MLKPVGIQLNSQKKLFGARELVIIGAATPFKLFKL